MKRGQFVTFEGIDGAGKSSQIEALAQWLTARGIEVVRTREPGGTPEAEKIRAMLLHDDMTVRTETLLFFAARSEHLARVIRPALERGAWVLSDRFTDATYAYQAGGKGEDPAVIEALEAIVQQGLTPDHTVLFDIAPDVARARMQAGRTETDRFESEGGDFFERVRGAYRARAAADPARFYLVNAAQTPEVIEAALLAEAQGWL